MLLAAPSVGALPERVRAIVAAQDRASERLIGTIQIAIGLLLALLYALAPRPDDSLTSMFAPVPLAIGAFLAFSAFRLYVILRRSLPGWFVGLSILADVGLLVTLIWSFHIQYGQPPGFSLKAPTFVYLFVFIVLRTLRFDPRYVLAAGLAAAVGWGLLTALVVHAAGPDAITRSYSAYIGDSRILIGAEVDKVLMLLLVTGILSLGARRAERNLIEAVRDEAAVKEIRRFLSKGVADQISRAETLIEAGRAVDREAAILMIDIRGFTPFSTTVAPKEVVRLLTQFHALIIPIVRANGGVIDKFLGDGVMATYGAAVRSETAAASALRALDGVLEASRRWEASLPALGITTALHVNAAVADGPVVFATLGDGDRLEYTVIGEAVNLAAKLEKHNKVERSRAALPATTLSRAIAQGYAPAEPYTVRSGASVAGVKEPLDLMVRLA